MDIETRKYLTEKVLGECWHKTDRSTQRCLYCGMKLMYFNHHIFTTRDDMMDLYQAIEKAGKWINFLNWVFNDLEEPDRGDSYYSTASIAWLLCLSGEGYEERCQMVSEFL